MKPHKRLYLSREEADVVIEALKSKGFEEPEKCLVASELLGRLLQNKAS